MLFFYLVLTSEQTQKLRNELAKARRRGNLTLVNRITAVLAVAESGASLADIAKIICVSTESIRSWVKKYLVSGIRGLIAQKKSPGRPTKLTKSQRRSLAQIISEGPQAAGFLGACWRSPMIQELILHKWGVFYNAHYISDLLKNMGFSYQKASFAVGGKDPKNADKRQEWIEKTWPEALAAAKKQKAYLLFGDEASFPQWGTLTYTWAKTGQQPTIKTSGIRKGYKVFGLVDYFSGRFFHQSIEERFNSNTYIDFLSSILSKTRKPIVLIQDRASYHTSVAVQQFVSKHPNRLTVYNLPPYSPDYNPIEKVWKKIKKDAIHLHYFPTFDNLKEKVNQALSDFATQGRKLLSTFKFYRELQTI
ncbi:MAG: IS630 family transposase [Pseudomonadota bacterium]